MYFPNGIIIYSNYIIPSYLREHMYTHIYIFTKYLLSHDNRYYFLIFFPSCIFNTQVQFKNRTYNCNYCPAISTIQLELKKRRDSHTHIRIYAHTCWIFGYAHSTESSSCIQKLYKLHAITCATHLTRVYAMGS